MKTITSILASATLLVFNGCAHLPLKPVLGQGLNGGVISVSYKPCSGNGKCGAVTCVTSTTSDLVHPTTWQVRKFGTTTWSAPHPTGATVMLVCNAATYADYEVLFTPTKPDAFTNNNPSILRIYPDRLAIVKFHYYR